jgi:oxygen-dependent protoporphyrinogen oxidase
MKSVAIIGAGITGLTAGFRLKQQGVPVTIYEASGRAGGVIRSIRENGYLAEFGPNTILETSPRIGKLIEDVGLKERRWDSDPGANKRFLARNHTLMEVPGSPGQFFSTPLFSGKAKLRLLAEPFIRRAPTDKEESVADLVLRRIGQEFLDYAINPLVAGIYAGDPARLSVKHAFPKLHALEQRYGSLILGQILGARERKRRAEVSKQDAKKVSFDEGLEVLTKALAEALREQIVFNTSVTCVQQSASIWKVEACSGVEVKSFEHSAVLYTGTAYRLPKIELTTGAVQGQEMFSEIHYPPVTSIVLGFKREDVAHPLDGFGVLIPQVENLHILGAIFSSSLFPNRAPAGHVTLTSYVGGTRAPALADAGDEKLFDLTIADLRTLLGVKGQPTFKHLVRYPKAIPQYEVGYGRFKEWMDRLEAHAPGIFLAGHYRDGISLGDSLVSGDKAAERVGEFVNRE